MNRSKNNRKIAHRDLRMKLAARGILSFASLARHIQCSRPAIYFALERPSRYPRVHKAIMEVIE